MRFHITLVLLIVASGLLAAPANISLLITVVQGERIEYLTDIETLKRTPDWTPGKCLPSKRYARRELYRSRGR